MITPREQAIQEAQVAFAADEVPVGAVIVDAKSGHIIASAHNEMATQKDPTAHAEILAIQAACRKQGQGRLEECDLYVTLEPCPMCAGAIAQSRISTVIFGAWDEKAGAVGSVWDLLRDPRALNKVEVRGGVLAEECSAMLKEFIQGVRKKD
jgi:tRNA(adenine34) deaminase